MTTKRKGIIVGYHAYCSSDKCSEYGVRVDNGKVKKYRLATLSIKNVDRGTVQCPDCHFILLWVDCKEERK